MRAIFQIISLLALIALTLPSILFLAGRMELDTVKWIMVLATIVWFVVTAPSMWKNSNDSQQQTG
ncbi:MAG: hypothetical protein JW837_07535 [Sedimentisphaerales bacterium]|nr:hypothetical protein [Sedimentisphaerales bacterium]